ncbi:replication protein A 70 kDa DNA-binding subunit [Pelomyxa schiedti]|nr:replication protein A 70 kDa DNA-binding subunit [Pelomyxa schiedti]
MLTEDGARLLFTTPMPKDGVVLQVLQLKLIQSGRYSVRLSDGVSSVVCIGASNTSELFSSGSISEGSIVRVDDCTVVPLPLSRRIPIIMKVSPQEPSTATIGDPVPLHTEEMAVLMGGTSTPPTAAPPVAPKSETANRTVKPEGPFPSASKPAPLTRKHNFDTPVMCSQPVSTPPSRRVVGEIIPITKLNPYISKWSINVRVVAKSPMRTWQKDDGSHSLFTMDLVDSSGEIRAVAFNAEAENFFPKIQLNKGYTVANGQLKFSDKKWNRLNHDYEIILGQYSEIIPLDPQQTSILPHAHFHFTTISSLQGAKLTSYVDVLGVVTQVSEEKELVTKAGKPLKQKVIWIADTTSSSVSITFWASLCDMPEVRNLSVGMIVGVKGLRVGEFSGVVLSATTGTVVIPSPQGYEQEVAFLQKWYKSGMATSCCKLSGRSVVSVLKEARAMKTVADAQVEESEIASNLSIRLTLTFIKKEGILYYPSCGQCSKKLIQVDDAWKCLKCEKNYETPVYRFIMQMRFADHTGSIWASCFDDVSAAILGVTATQLHQLKQKGDDHAVERICTNAQFKQFICKVHVTPRAASGFLRRQRYGIIQATPVSKSFVHNNQVLLQCIRNLLA